jgi:formamidopyrimidine-DNA glycosylase
MPELPEAETVRAQLEPQLVGRRIESAWARLDRIAKPSAAAWAADLQGAYISGARRRGKQIYFPLDTGSHLLIHLGMTGRLHIESDVPSFDPDTAHKHVQAVVRLDNATRLVFTDPRTFGAVGASRELPFLSAMGPEPLDEDFDGAALAARLSGRKTKIKAAILDQALVAGLGNIYADEVCFLSGVHPEQRACDVPLEKLQVLVSHMKPVLEKAIAARGATLKDGGYQDTTGRFGEYRPLAYGRKGEPCHNCGASIQRGVLGPGKSARSYHFCPECQPLNGPVNSPAASAPAVGDVE